METSTIIADRMFDDGYCHGIHTRTECVVEEGRAPLRGRTCRNQQSPNQQFHTNHTASISSFSVAGCRECVSAFDVQAGGTYELRCTVASTCYSDWSSKTNQ